MTDRTPEILVLHAKGWGQKRIAKALNIPRSTVQRRIQRANGRPVSEPLAVANEALAALGLVDRTFREDGESATVETRVPRFIKTPMEAVEASDIDLDTWTVVGTEVRHYPIQTQDGPIQGSYVKLRLSRKTITSDPDALVSAIEEGLEAALAARTITPRAVVRHTRPSVLRTRIITDLHIGGYAWSKSTGGESWDIATATERAHACNRYLDANVPEDATETLIAFLGDLFHADTPKGTTTSGTQLDLDSRVDLMLAAVSEYAVTTVSEEAERRPVTVLLVTGNHDDILSRALRRMLLLVFREHRNVTVLEQFTKRQYHRFGHVLQGFSHGETDRRRLADAMAVECGALGLWDGARCRELHLGHLHHEAARQKLYTGAETFHGTVVRTHLALTPPDQYHSDNGWIGSATGMADYLYHHSGAMIGTRIASPLLLEAA